MSLADSSGICKASLHWAIGVVGGTLSVLVLASKSVSVLFGVICGFVTLWPCLLGVVGVLYNLYAKMELQHGCIAVTFRRVPGWVL